MPPDYSISDEKWDIYYSDVSNFIDSIRESEYVDMVPVLEWNLEEANNDRENRVRFWNSIRTLFGLMPMELKPLSLRRVNEDTIQRFAHMIRPALNSIDTNVILSAGNMSDEDIVNQNAEDTAKILARLYQKGLFDGVFEEK